MEIEGNGTGNGLKLRKRKFLLTKRAIAEGSVELIILNIISRNHLAKTPQTHLKIYNLCIHVIHVTKQMKMWIA